jgi:2-(1,2-epoxy-1,2-dihydrophenyl)acetyl-CoA isomerase
MLLNEPLSAERAKGGAWCGKSSTMTLLEEAKQLARRLAEGPTALVAARLLIEESEHASYAAQFRREIELQAEIRTSADAQEDAGRSWKAQGAVRSVAGRETSRYRATFRKV